MTGTVRRRAADSIWLAVHRAKGVQTYNRSHKMTALIVADSGQVIEQRRLNPKKTFEVAAFVGIATYIITMPGTGVILCVFQPSSCAS